MVGQRPIQKLQRDGDNYRITVPIDLARRWIKEGVVSVQIEWMPPSLVITPITLKGLDLLKTQGIKKEELGGDRLPKR